MIHLVSSKKLHQKFKLYGQKDNLDTQNNTNILALYWLVFIFAPNPSCIFCPSLCPAGWTLLEEWFLIWWYAGEIPLACYAHVMHNITYINNPPPTMDDFHQDKQRTILQSVFFMCKYTHSRIRVIQHFLFYWMREEARKAFAFCILHYLQETNIFLISIYYHCSCVKG